MITHDYCSQKMGLYAQEFWRRVSRRLLVNKEAKRLELNQIRNLWNQR